MVGFHHRLNGDEFEVSLGVGDGQGGLVWCSPWGGKEFDTTEQLNWTVLCSRTSLFIHPACNSLHLIIPNSQSIPLPTHCHLPCVILITHQFSSHPCKARATGVIFLSLEAVAAAAKLLQLCPTLCSPIDGSPPSSTVPGILQARTLEWVSISFSNAWKWKVKVNSLSRVWLLATPWTAAYQDQILVHRISIWWWYNSVSHLGKIQSALLQVLSSGFFCLLLKSGARPHRFQILSLPPTSCVTLDSLLK